MVPPLCLGCSSSLTARSCDFLLQDWTSCPDGRGKHLQHLMSSSFAHPRSVTCSVRRAEWTHGNRHQGTAQCKFWPLLPFLLLNSKLTFLLWRKEVCCLSWSNSQLSCLHFLNARVSHVLLFPAYICILSFLLLCYNISPHFNQHVCVGGGARFITDLASMCSCSMKSHFFTFYGLALCFVDTWWKLSELSGPQHTNFYVCTETHDAQN